MPKTYHLATTATHSRCAATLIEYEPVKRNVYLLFENQQIEKLTVSFPYMVFVIKEQSYRGRPLNTLHIGCRSKPLDPDNLLEETLFAPSVAGNYYYVPTFMVCCKADIDLFWSSPNVSRKEKNLLRVCEVLPDQARTVKTIISEGEPEYCLGHIWATYYAKTGH